MSSYRGKKIAIWAAALVLVAAMIAVAAAACGSDAEDTDGANQDTAGKGLALTEADNGGDFTVKVGDTIAVTLVGNMTTGYEWASDMSAEDAALLTLSGSGPVYEPDEVQEDIVGSGGKFIFTFTAAAAGQVELKLKHWRAFEPDTAPIDTFTANITIE
jgi:predicted secreted protein